MKILTTPMCDDVLKIAGIRDYEVVLPSEINDADGDVIITLSETEVKIDKIPIKLNSYKQLLDSIMMLSERFNTENDCEKIEYIENLINQNNEKKDKRKDIKVKVYANFLKDTLVDMGFNVVDEDYDYVVVADYMDVKLTDDMIVVSSHKNVSRNIIDRLNERYELLENKLCMQQ